MKRSAFFLMFAILLCVSCSSSETNQKSEPSDPYKAVLDRLQSLSIQAESRWRFHADVPHPEDLTLNDSDWSVIGVKNISGPEGKNEGEEHWTGTRVFRRWIQV